jgi:hypothetical protein
MSRAHVICTMVALEVGSTKPGTKLVLPCSDVTATHYQRRIKLHNYPSHEPIETAFIPSGILVRTLLVPCIGTVAAAI